MSRCVRKTKKGAAALLYFGSNTHTTQEESAESGRSDFTGTILFFHRYKITYGYDANICLEEQWKYQQVVHYI